MRKVRRWGSGTSPLPSPLGGKAKAELLPRPRPVPPPQPLLPALPGHRTDHTVPSLLRKSLEGRGYSFHICISLAWNLTNVN